MKLKVLSLKSSILAVLAVLVASCATPKEILYLQDLAENTKEVSLNHENVIMKGDKLNILVSGQDKTVTSPYNQTLFEVSTSGGGNSANPESATIPYYVDENGNIDFPKIGRVYVEGMTIRELREFLTDEIKKDVKDVTVSVSIKNFKVHIIGEVRSPGLYTMEADSPITIFKALSRAGDLALTAQRNDVIVLREENGIQTHYTVDLRKSSVFDSPAYFIQQNDVIIVQPSSRRIMSGTSSTGLWSFVLSSITTAVSVITLIVKL